MPARSRVLKEAGQTDLMLGKLCTIVQMVALSGHHSWYDFGKSASVFHPSCCSGDLDTSYTAGSLLLAGPDPVQESGCAWWALLQMLMQGYGLVWAELGSSSAVVTSTANTLRTCRGPSLACNRLCDEQPPTPAVLEHSVLSQPLPRIHHPSDRNNSQLLQARRSPTPSHPCSWSCSCHSPMPVQSLAF